MIINTSLLNFGNLHKTSTKKAGVTIPDSSNDSLFIDAFPPCFIKSKNPEEGKKNLIAFCKDISPVVSVIKDIQFCKYGNGSFYGYSDFDDEITAREFRKFQAMDEEKYFAENLDRLLKKYKFINLKTKVIVENLSKDSISHAGFGYKITLKNGKEENYLFAKIFHSNIEEKGRQGIYSEIPIRIYFNHNKVDHSDFPHFYFGETKNGFLFAEFIEKDRKKIGFIYPDKLLGIDFRDSNNSNYIGSCRIDAGGIYPINTLAVNVVARGVAKKIFRMSETDKVKKWNEYFDTNFSNKDSVVAGLMYSIELLPKHYRKKAYLKILKSDFMKAKEVKLAELLSIELREMLFSKADNIKYFKSEFRKLDKNNLLTEDEKEYLNYKLLTYKS